MSSHTATFFKKVISHWAPMTYAGQAVVTPWLSTTYDFFVSLWALRAYGSSCELGQLALTPLQVQGTDGAQRLLAGAVELVLPEGNVVLEFGDFFLLVHSKKVCGVFWLFFVA